MIRYVSNRLTVLELCAGGGGQALGLEQAGFESAALGEIDPHACATLRANRPHWRVEEADLCEFDAADFRGVDLVAAGVPCPPFSIAGKQLGANDERDLFPAALRVVEQTRPRAVMLENVRRFATARFDNYRSDLLRQLLAWGYDAQWHVLNASDYGVPQLRPRFVLVGIRAAKRPFDGPQCQESGTTVGSVLGPLMGARDWPGLKEWRLRAQGIGPTIVGGSKKHGGPDLGPTRAKRQWRSLGVDGLGIANEPPGPEFPAAGFPRLTIPLVAALQGFPGDWRFAGKKTAAYRQVGNAFPPPAAAVVGQEISHALGAGGNERRHRRRILEESAAAVYKAVQEGRGSRRSGCQRP